MRPLRRTTALAGALLLWAALAGAADAKGQPGLPHFPRPLDAQSWVLPDHMTWGDYVPIPGYDWNDPARQPPKQLRAALILADFPDREFVITEPSGSDLVGNPIGLGSIPRDEVAEWYEEFLITTPQHANHFHTVNEYWLEDSYGLVGVDADAFGPYRMDFNEYQYGLNEFNQQGDCPEAGQCEKDFDAEVLQDSLPDVTLGTVTNGGRDYDFRFLLHAGYDESGTWQEFGEMRFQSPEDVPDGYGNPNPDSPNSARTRYIPWTSFWAAKGIWSHATPGVMSTQGENDGPSTYAHEFSHILGVLDNYNNPYGVPLRRSYSGPWDMMSRGTFNGAGGPHNRWQIPPTLGGSMGSHHMLRNKIRMGFTKPGEVLVLQRDALAQTGPVFADIWARAVPVGPGTGRSGLHGLQIAMGEDRSPACSIPEDWRCDGGGYNNYTVEVVDRMGYDSFTPDHGVLIAKTKNADTAPFIWVIDSHPEDFNLVDFVRPSGEPAMISRGDYRQLADALFHSGTGAGVVSEYVDEANRLHLYVIGTDRDEEGVLSYRVAVRSLDGGGPFTRGVAVTDGSAQPAARGRVAVYRYEVTNTGQDTDIVRLSATTSAGWPTRLLQPFVEIGAGQTVEVPVFVKVPRSKTSTWTPTLVFTASSETDPTKTSTSSRPIGPAQ